MNSLQRYLNEQLTFKHLTCVRILENKSEEQVYVKVISEWGGIFLSLPISIVPFCFNKSFIEFVVLL
jgi:hypothetical protein